MTSNQIAARQARETERSNRANEQYRKDDLDFKKKADRRKGTRELIKTAVSAISPVSALLNDPSWYDKNPAATKAAANISWHTPLGQNIPPMSRIFALANKYSQIGEVSAPGIMNLTFVPTIGDDVNTVNIAINKIYTHVRYANSGARNYEAVDYGLFLLAADSLISNFCLATKMYKAYVTYSSQNKFIGYGILRGCGVQADEIEEELLQLAPLRSRYNQLVSQFNSLLIPQVFDYVTRHGWMSHMIFADDPNAGERTQIYQFMPRGYYKFVSGENTSDQAGALEYFSFNRSSGFTLSFLLNVIAVQIKALLMMEDFGIMGGDSLKAFGDTKMYRLEYLDDMPQLEIKYSEEVLCQISNATLFGDVGSATVSFYQKGGLLYQGNIDGTSPGIVTYVSSQSDTEFQALPGGSEYFEQLEGTIINAYVKDQSPRDNMVATALTALHGKLRVYNLAGKYSLVERPTAYGSEIIVGCSISNFIKGSLSGNQDQLTLTSFAMSDQMILPYSPSGTDLTFSLGEGLFGYLWSSFDWSPKITVFRKTTSAETASAPLQVVYSKVVLKNFAVIEAATLSNIHDTALMSLFSVPGVGVEKAGKF